jgi:alkylation response protein AidB-like acyl-CoA dehydrogenase
MRTRQLPPAAVSLIRLFSGESGTRRAEIALEIAGPAAVLAGELDVGVRFIARQGGSLGGGSTEMARNIISERILGMPREYAADKDIPFSQVKKGR